MNDNENGHQRVVLVTGAASGIGQGLAQRFFEDGARVALADINVGAAEKVASELRGSGEAIAIESDVTSEASVQATVAAVLERWGRLDVLCANAGIYPAGLIEEITEEDWDRVHNVNLKGAFFCIKHAVAPMRKQKHGRIVLTSSITGPVTGFPGWSHYGASKAGQLGLIRSAALELARDGITINAVMPGNVRTPAWAENSVEFMQATEHSIPIGRLAEPADIAHAVHFFAANESAYITGQTVIVDGGQILPESPMEAN